MKKQFYYAFSLLLAAVISGAALSAPARADEFGMEKRNMASPSQAQYQYDQTPEEETAVMKPVSFQIKARSSKASNVLTLTGSGTHDLMRQEGDPGVYLLFQGANYRGGFNSMISDHTTDGSARQLDGIWQYYKTNGVRTMDSPVTKIWKGTGSYSNAEEVKVADFITITNTTDMVTGAWNTTVEIVNPHPKLTGVMFYYYAPFLYDYGGVTIFPLTDQMAVTGAEAAHTHSGVLRTEPGCTTPGSISGRCEMCGDVSESIPPLGHSVPADYDRTSQPGYKIKNCGRCGERLETVANSYQVVYEGNGATGGSTPGSGQRVGSAFPLAANGFVKTGYEFQGWNSQADGNGVSYQPGQTTENLTLEDGGTVHLYARWKPGNYTVFFDPLGGSCQETQRAVIYDSPYGELPQAKKLDHQFLGWCAPESSALITPQTLYQKEGNTTLKAVWKLVFEDLGSGTNRRPGEDGVLETEDDSYYYNGKDGQAGTEDDIPLSPGSDGIYGTGDDCYEDSDGVTIHAGGDTIFDTKDDYVDNEDGTNRRPGEDLTWGTEDDEQWWNGEDKEPGTQDDKKIHPGEDGEYGTKDDYVDNEDGTNRRPGEDLTWGTEDDEQWWNGEDKEPGTEDDKKIHPGEGGEYGTKDDYVDNEDGTNRRPGEDLTWGTEDDEQWWNGEDKEPGTEDDKKIHPGEDGEYGTKDDYVDNEDGTNRRPGEDLTWGTEDDEQWWNGEDKEPGTQDDKKIHPGEDGEYGTKDDYVDNEDGTNRRPGEDLTWGTEDDEQWDNGDDKVPGTGDDTLWNENNQSESVQPNPDSSGTSGDKNTGGNNTSSGNSSDSGGSHSGGGSGWSTVSVSGSSSHGGPGTGGSVMSLLGTGKTGEWEKLPDGWIFRYSDGSRAKSTWDYLYYGVTGRTDWYRFGDDEYMKTGWYQDTDGSWYFLHTISDGTLGHMKTGWHRDGDGRWYYLNPVSDGHRGAMYTGWHHIDGKWYYFNPVSDGTKGAMYANCQTPDGYLVGEDGAWIQ